MTGEEPIFVAKSSKKEIWWGISYLVIGWLLYDQTRILELNNVFVLD